MPSNEWAILLRDNILRSNFFLPMAARAEVLQRIFPELRNLTLRGAMFMPGNGRMMESARMFRILSAMHRARHMDFAGTK